MYNLSNYNEIAAAEKEAKTRAGNEPNQNGYNAAWLHGYAHALGDVRKQLDPAPHYAVIKWSIEDIQAICPDWDEEKCAKWWQENERFFKETLTQYGNEILSNSF